MDKHNIMTWTQCDVATPPKNRPVLLQYEHNMAVGYMTYVFDEKTPSWVIYCGDNQKTDPNDYSAPIAWAPLPEVSYEAH